MYNDLGRGSEFKEFYVFTGDSPVMYSDDQEMSVEEVTKSAGSTVSCENAVETEPCAGSGMKWQNI